MTVVKQRSPFHAGELEVQNLVGVDKRILDIGQRVIRDHLLPQHQEFYHSQHQLLLSIVDSNGRPWVAIVAGEPGFVTALNARRLRINALPIGLSGSSTDEAFAQLAVGGQVGVLGIDYSTRRRNRVNGRVLSVDAAGFEIQVVQSFGNCPKYIQTRDTDLPQLRVWQAPPVAGVSMAALDDDWRALIGTADHFFIASHYDKPGDEMHHGADVSHRGGRPGFVRIDSYDVLEFPDFSGNRFYNTLGNIATNGKAALLFVDFHTGSLLSMTGEAQVIWQDESTSGFAGAERLVRFKSTQIRTYIDALPFQWHFKEQSPALEHTGHWS